MRYMTNLVCFVLLKVSLEDFNYISEIFSNKKLPQFLLKHFSYSKESG
jgi:hypothetical protein